MASIPSNLESKSDASFPPLLGLSPSPYGLFYLPSICFFFFPFCFYSFSKLYFSCHLHSFALKNRGSFDLHPKSNKTFLFFHWAQAVPTRYRNRSPCICRFVICYVCTVAKWYLIGGRRWYRWIGYWKFLYLWAVSVNHDTLCSGLQRSYLLVVLGVYII